MSGSAPVVTLDPSSVECNEGDTITVTVSTFDADTRTEVVTGANADGVPVVVTSAAVDSASIVSARFSTSGVLARVSGMTVIAVAVLGAGDLEITVRDAEGNETVATCKVTVKAPAPTMLIGSDRPGVQVAMYPGMRYFRAYSQAGRGILPLPSPRGLLYHMSFKDTPTSALLQGWFKTLPSRSVLATPKWALPFDVIVEWNHEPEGDMTAVAYRAGVDVVKAEAAAWNKAHPAGPTVAVWQTMTGYAQRHPTAKNAMKDLPPVVSSIANLWRQVDGLGVDMEKDTVLWPGGFTDPEAAFGWIRDAAKALKVPWGLPEFGDASSDPGRAGRHTKNLAWLGKNGCAFTGVYDTDGQTADYTLAGDELAAVKAAIAAQ